MDSDETRVRKPRLGRWGGAGQVEGEAPQEAQRKPGPPGAGGSPPRWAARQPVRWASRGGQAELQARSAVGPRAAPFSLGLFTG